MQAGDWVALAAALIAVVALIWTRGQAKSAKEQADSAREQVQLAKRQTEVQERLYRDQQQPYIWVDYRIDPVSYWLIDLVMKNEGPTVATNVRVSFDPPIQRSGVKKWELESLPGFAEGFASFPPGREMRWSLGSHVDVFEEAGMSRHDVTIAFDGPFGPVEPLTYVLDYADGKAMALRDRGNLKSLSKAVNESTKAVRGIEQILERHLEKDTALD